jgi:PKD repeat protein
VWNLSTGGNGNLAYSWNFGDGTSSNEAYPTHTYDGNGPYNLCLTIMDNNGCNDTFCDSVSINGDGIYEGMVVHAEDRQEGFTINVQQPVASGVQEVVASGSIATWPNPAVDELNVAVVSGMKGFVTVTITDLDGRTVKTERTSLGGGRNQLRIATSGLNAGLYMLRITDGSTNLSQRFVKTN